MSDVSTVDHTAVITPDQLLNHWQGHRSLSRRMIDAFPEDQLFTFSVGSMRTYGVLTKEMLQMAEPMVRGIVTGDWTEKKLPAELSKAELLRLWDESTTALNELWPQISVGRFQERMVAFGQFEGRTIDLLLYVIDNEIHHRGQGYVYLRALGVEPPPFWDRPRT